MMHVYSCCVFLLMLLPAQWIIAAPRDASKEDGANLIQAIKLPDHEPVSDAAGDGGDDGGEDQRSNIDQMINVIKGLSSSVPQIKELLDQHHALYRQVHQQKLQTEPVALALVSEQLENCGPMLPSEEVPKTVHRLRPADIRVVGAVGDSLTAANGAKALTVFGVLLENRGVSASIGGDMQYDDVITTPNILRVINPQLYGYSTGTSTVNNVDRARLNLAVPGSEARHMVKQVTNLIQRMRADPQVDFDNDWKMVTLFIGGNDLCNYCTDRDFYSPQSYAHHISLALDLLHEQLPRAVVNVLVMVDMSVIVHAADSLVCSFVHGLICPCEPHTSAQLLALRAQSLAYQASLEALVDSGRYDTKPHFTVVAQPFLKHTVPPRMEDGSYDYSYWAPDCFHFSEKAHRVAGQALWNNLLEPVGGKTEHWMLGEPLKCASQKQPYIATRVNSGDGMWFPREQ